MDKKILKEIYAHKDINRVKILARFFKTGRGGYGEGDKFLGMRVPVIRHLARRFKDAPTKDIFSLLKNKYHEVRLLSLFILAYKYKKGNKKEKKEIVDFYLANTKYINNWDLVDLSAPHILGNFSLENKDHNILFQLVKSKNLWQERMAIIATLSYIRKGEFGLTFKIAEVFLNHKHDLIHKATGWMLREVGKRNPVLLCKFLDQHAKIMPRTMLRYAIEKFPHHIRKEYLRK